MLIIDYKAYEQSIGNHALSLGKYAEDVSRKYNVPIILCPNVIDLALVARGVTIPVYAQHVDMVDPINAGSGFLPIKIAVQYGVKGALLNTSFHKLSWVDLEKSIQKYKEIGFKTVIFADSLQQLGKVKELFPDYIVFEPEELKLPKVSLRKDKSGMIEKAVAIVRTNLIIGAGIKDPEDALVACRLGAAGVYVSSAVMLQRNSKKYILEYAKAVM